MRDADDGLNLGQLALDGVRHTFDQRGFGIAWRRVVEPVDGGALVTDARGDKRIRSQARDGVDGNRVVAADFQILRRVEREFGARWF